MGIISPEVRLAVLLRSGNLCEDCRGPGDFRGLALHHKIHKGMGGRKGLDTVENLVLLCGRCHNAQHGIPEQ